MKVLVGGGTGFVGRHLVKCLTSQGAKVQIISRKENTSKNHLSWEAIKKYGLPEGTDSVVNLAGRNIFDPMPWINTFKNQIYHSRIDTNRTLVEAIKNAKVKPKSFIHVSGVGYYEPNKTKIYTEEWKQPEGNRLVECNYFMKLANDWEKSGQLDDETSKETRRVVIRSGVVLGSDGGLVQNFKPMFLLGLGQTFGDGKQWFPWIHVKDLSELFAFCIKNDHVNGIINGTVPDHKARNIDFAEAFAKAMKTSVKVNMPSLFVKLMFGLDRAEVILEGSMVQTRAPTLGFEYKYPTLDKAFEEIVNG